MFVGGELLGGATETLAALEDGSLAARLAVAAAAGRGALPPALQQAVRSVLGDSHGGGGWNDAQRAKLEKVAERLRAARLDGGGGAFTLSAALAWARESGLAGSRAAGAADLLAQLQAAQLLTMAEPSGAAAKERAITPELAEAQPGLRLRLVADLPTPARLSAPLNGHFRWFGPARPAAAVSAELRRRMLELFDRHVTADGRK